MGNKKLIARLKKGILNLEIKEKHPSVFVYKNDIYGHLENLYLSFKYGNKLDSLDTLICIRDEYNEIDGFDDRFRFGEPNYCIVNKDNKLQILYFEYKNEIMHFGKKETAEIFLKNFKKELEQIKEFL